MSARAKGIARRLRLPGTSHLLRSRRRDSDGDRLLVHQLLLLELERELLLRELTPAEAEAGHRSSDAHQMLLHLLLLLQEPRLPPGACEYRRHSSGRRHRELGSRRRGHETRGANR